METPFESINCMRMTMPAGFFSDTDLHVQTKSNGPAILVHDQPKSAVLEGEKLHRTSTA